MKPDYLSRRRLIAGLALTTGLSALSGCARPPLNIDTPNLNPAPNSGALNQSKTWYELGLMEDEVLEQIFIFYMSHTWHQMSDIGECLDTANRIEKTAAWSWPHEWEKTAMRLQKLAVQSETAGHLESAGEAYLRAGNYFIAALHRHPDHRHKSVKILAKQAVQSFSKSISHMGISAKEVKIPYEGTTLPGYFFRAPNTGKNTPTLIVFNGRDAWAVQGKGIAQAGNKRGYHVLLVDGPGQGPVLRLQGLPFRPDWEAVITPAVDFALKQQGVDKSRIGVLGISMGGILIPRAAAFEHRPKVYIANPGVVSWYDTLVPTIGQLVGPENIALIDTDPEAFNARVNAVAEHVPLVKWGMEDSYWKHGVSTASELMKDLRRYDISSVVPNIRSKMLLMDSRVDEWAQTETLQKLLKSPVDVINFDGEFAGQLHSQTGAWAIQIHRLYNWLDENLKQ